jgi:hypothetical protein
VTFHRAQGPRPQAWWSRTKKCWVDIATFATDGKRLYSFAFLTHPQNTHTHNTNTPAQTHAADTLHILEAMP